MTRPNRVKNFRFGANELIANAAGLFDSFSAPFVVNGAIQKIDFTTGNYGANGSLFILVSGTEELIWKRNGTANTNAIGVYPFVYPVNNANTTGSPQAFTQRTINGVIHIVGSGLGNTKSGVGLDITYI